ncbi:hypothetical protein LUZ63_016897 [Rhynchospora breviuscula]|uniref:Reverse transcriptase zinc-binding domain-containing protein n=1 Tax=Rhynchospora breviuscula TaxID=2022672 RepID=A0A9Q0C1F8_9POAL|nr:hypothetical protein LUZ63_016897 [Rhynchospora breviuscula]
MKNLWAIVQGEKSTWVKVLHAKYLSTSDIWSSSRTTRCTPLWRALLQVREFMKGHVKWQIGDGKECKAMGQPWHEMWTHFPPANAAQRRVTVNQLVDEVSGNWKNQKLIELFGFHGALYIAMTHPNGPSLSQRQDRLVFTFNKNGRFTIKGAYLLLLKGPAYANTAVNDNPVHKLIWHVRHILPRTRIFLWRAVKEALPVDAVFAQRLATPPKGCPVCGAQQETAAHTLFKCPRAQQVWLSSDFGLRTADLPDKIEEILVFLINSLEERHLANLVAILWFIWKDRRKEVFEGKKGNATNTLAAAYNLLHTLQAANCQFTRPSNQNHDSVPNTRFKCWVDASWVHNRQDGSGLAYVLFDGEELEVYKLSTAKSSSPFYAELLALKMALHLYFSFLPLS